VFVNIVFGDQDKISIKNVYQLKGYKAMELTNKSSNIYWTNSSTNRLLKKRRTMKYPH